MSVRSVPATPDLPDTSPPPLKWAGGKRWLVPHIQARWRRYQFRRYVEPFCGGLAMALGLQPKHAWLNDANAHVVNFYGWLQRGLVIGDAVRLEHDADVYYANRARFNQLIREEQADSDEAAALFYYLNRTGYNGLCRFNRAGEFNVPFGQYKTITYKRDFRDYVPDLAGWEFTSGDFEAMTLQPDDFVYSDPPYDVEFVSYSKDGFSWADQERLAHWLARHPGPVIASNQATERIIQLYGDLGFTLEYHDAPRRISNNGDRTPAQEIVATRNLAYASPEAFVSPDP